MLLAAVSCLSVAGEDEICILPGLVGVIPPGLTNDGKAVVYLSTDIVTEVIDEVSILDEDFKVVSSFSIDTEEPVGFRLASEEIGVNHDLLFYFCKGLFSDDYNYVKWNRETYQFNVFDTAGKQVANIEIPDGYRLSYFVEPEYITILNWNSNKYVIIESLKKGEETYGEESYLAVYKINEDSDVVHIATLPSVGITPRTPKKGEAVKVMIDSEVARNGCDLQVVSASGQSMLNASVPSGQTQYDVDTSRYPKGVYMVTISSEGYKKESAKIIIR